MKLYMKKGKEKHKSLYLVTQDANLHNETHKMANKQRRAKSAMVNALTAGRVSARKSVARLHENSRERGIMLHFHDVFT